VPFGETDDNGVYTYTDPLTTDLAFAHALVWIDSGLAVVGAATDVNSVSVRNALYLTRARILLNRATTPAGFTAAATVAANVTGTTFQYLFDYSQTTQDNEWWVMQSNSKRYSVGDSQDASGVIANAIPYVSLNDTRVPLLSTTAGKSFDGVTPYFETSLFGRSTPVAAVAGLDGQLIQAEAKLQANDFVGMMAILNALRAAPPALGTYQPKVLTPLAVPATFAAARDLFFREKALWTFGRGQRLGDYRRLLRQYGLTMAQVYPSGKFFKNGTYDVNVSFPVPDDEKTNTKFTGCLDTTK